MRLWCLGMGGLWGWLGGFGGSICSGLSRRGMLWNMGEEGIVVVIVVVVVVVVVCRSWLRKCSSIRIYIIGIVYNRDNNSNNKAYYKIITNHIIINNRVQ